MTSTDITGRSAIVTGASRGFGRAIAVALSKAGAQVTGGSFIPARADAADPVVAGRLIDEHQPTILVLNAGAAPLSRPIQRHTWETFSQNWDVDVRHAFGWVREALLAPLPPGSVVVTMSSGAALRGSPLSGGYAGSKATIRFLTSYAAAESARGELGIRFVSVLPQLTPATRLGAAAVAAYAARQGTDVPGYLAAAGPTLTAEQVGSAITELITDPGQDRDAYLLTAGGLSQLP
jgi:NAD(P)-dependent dehydrogenase (short-subunit alcohol dehydrogenase family)